MSRTPFAMDGPSANERLEFRLASVQKQTIAAAATLLGLDISEFARQVLTERSHEILADRETHTVVPANFFDELVAALDQPLTFNPALEKATQRSRELIATDYPRQ